MPHLPIPHGLPRTLAYQRPPCAQPIHQPAYGAVQPASPYAAPAVLMDLPQVRSHAPAGFAAPSPDASARAGFRGASPGRSPLRAIDPHADYSDLLLGPVIATGGAKCAHRIYSPSTGMPTGDILLIEQWRRDRSIPREIGHLALLNEMGLPVAPVESSGQYRGHCALRMPEMLGTFHPFMVRFPGWLDGLLVSPLVTRETVKSLQQILRQIDFHGIHLRDMQVLMDPHDGRLYITDPQSFREGTTQDHFWGRWMPNLLGTRKPLGTMLEVLYQRFPDMNPGRRRA